MKQLSKEEREILESKRQETQVYSRVCWWIVPRHRMNPWKLSERAQMTPYEYEESMKHKLNRVNWVALEQQYCC